MHPLALRADAATNTVNDFPAPPALAPRPGASPLDVARATLDALAAHARAARAAEEAQPAVEAATAAPASGGRPTPASPAPPAPSAKPAPPAAPLTDAPRSLDVGSDTSDDEAEESLTRLAAKYGVKG